MKIVERGAALLDEVRPGWEKEIDQEELDLGSSCGCVLGQLYLRDHPRTRNKWEAYDRMANELGLEDDGTRARLGFLAYGTARYFNMNRAWLREIRRRLS